MSTVAEVLACSLKELGVKYVFGVPSGNWVDYMAAIEKIDGLEFILISNEGSGGYAMMAGEMATAARLGGRIVFIVLNDGYLSLISLKQELKGHSRYGTLLSNAAGSLPATGSMFGVPVIEVNDADQYRQALKAGFSSDGPVIIEAFIDGREYEELVLKGNR